MNIMTKRGAADNVVVYEHWCDTEDDLRKIDSSYITLGSVAVVLNGGRVKMYIANSNKEWKSVSEGSDASASDIEEIKTQIEQLTSEIQSLTEKNPLSEDEVDTKLSAYAQKAEIPKTVAELSDAEEYAKKDEIPTTVAGLEDGEEYAKKNEIPSTVAELDDGDQYAKKSEIPTTVARLSDASDYAKKSELPVAIFGAEGNVTLSEEQLTKLAAALQEHLGG